ncbi:inorganic phosphate transporter [Rothia sp. AR01]|uniref:Inorganic phosphate transporter n=1 Tax=Rothia santali TaxID=2949643 RepID=A0A9X2HI61_9MICC|nr:inorganic phosphate transporter [Rothia santali]MCP3426151.1 inorganic phosphate transporter [Rothia santali]
MTAILFGLCCALLLVFAAFASFHDVPNAVAVPVRARAVTARIGVSLSALFNVLGLLLGVVTLPLVGDRWLQIPDSQTGLGILAATLLTVIAWEAVTWWWGMPSSATHALVGGLLGALWAASAVGLSDDMALAWDMVGAVWLPLLLGPVLAFVIGWLAVVPLVRVFRYASPQTVNRRARYALTLALSCISLAHGLFFGHRLLVLALMMFLGAGIGYDAGTLWLLCLPLAACLVLGTLGGGWRIAYTLGSRMVKVDPFRGAIAQVTTTLLAFGSGAITHEPHSASQLAASAMLGAGSNQRFNAVRVRTATRIVGTWLLTIPVCAVGAAVFFLALSPLL